MGSPEPAMTGGAGSHVDASEAESPRHSRRAIIGGLAAAAAGGAGIAGTLIATASPAAAGVPDGAPMLLGESNQTTDTTSLQNSAGTCLSVASATGQPVVMATDTTPNSNGASPALYAQSDSSAGVVGTSNSDAGVVGVSTSSDGVFGQSTSGVGVYGQLLGSSATLGIAAVYGLDPTTAGGNTGVQGQSFNGIGVNGIANFPQGSGGIGVAGQTYGDGGSGVGASDSSTNGGFGVQASTDNGVAISGYVSGQGNGNGIALQINGPSQFITAGTAVIPKGSSSVTVNVSYVTPDSLVLATMQQLVPGRSIAAAVAGHGTVTIYLNTVANMPVPVGFFAIARSNLAGAARPDPVLPSTHTPGALRRMHQTPTYPKSD